MGGIEDFSGITVKGRAMSESLEAFLGRIRVDNATWQKSDSDINLLLNIEEDYISRRDLLRKSADLYSSIVQSLPRVHSVRSRIKDPSHLLEKIVRKRALGDDKYSAIDVDSYSEKITDLVGIRALHLFKDDYFEVSNGLLGIWRPVEKPIAYIRAGDPDELRQKYVDFGMDVREHPKGYRSIHFVFSARPISKEVFFEVQVRTIFEEGWSEIDHAIRYPNFSDNKLIEYFLAIFNRISGNADEMGTFVKDLSSSICDYQLKIAEAQRERDDGLKAMESILLRLEEYKNKDKSLTQTVESLKKEVSKMKQEKSALQIAAATAALFGLTKTSGEPSLAPKKYVYDVNENAASLLAGLTKKSEN